MSYVQTGKETRLMGKKTAGTDRLEVRLGREHRRKLEEIARSRKLTVSETVRRIIEQTYEQELRARRREAAEGLSRLEVEDVPDPDTLTGQLEAAHEPPDVR
jgi:hypothetical protein